MEEDAWMPFPPQRGICIISHPMYSNVGCISTWSSLRRYSTTGALPAWDAIQRSVCPSEKRSSISAPKCSSSGIIMTAWRGDCCWGWSSASTSLFAWIVCFCVELFSQIICMGEGEVWMEAPMVVNNHWAISQCECRSAMVSAVIPWLFTSWILAEWCMAR